MRLCMKLRMTLCMATLALGFGVILASSAVAQREARDTTRDRPLSARPDSAGTQRRIRAAPEAVRALAAAFGEIAVIPPAVVLFNGAQFQYERMNLYGTRGRYLDRTASSLGVTVRGWVKFTNSGDAGGHHFSLYVRGPMALPALVEIPRQTSGTGGNWNDEIASFDVLPDDNPQFEGDATVCSMDGSQAVCRRLSKTIWEKTGETVADGWRKFWKAIGNVRMELPTQTSDSTPPPIPPAPDCIAQDNCVADQGGEFACRVEAAHPAELVFYTSPEGVEVPRFVTRVTLTKGQTVRISSSRRQIIYVHRYTDQPRSEINRAHRTEMWCMNDDRKSVP
jgi:hypothetical protein